MEESRQDGGWYEFLAAGPVSVLVCVAATFSVKLYADGWLAALLLLMGLHSLARGLMGHFRYRALERRLLARRSAA
jgi:hypothetical protein